MIKMQKSIKETNLKIMKENKMMYKIVSELAYNLTVVAVLSKQAIKFI